MSKETKGQVAFKHLIQTYPELAVQVDKMIEQDGWVMKTAYLSSNKHYSNRKRVTIPFVKELTEKEKTYLVNLSMHGNWYWECSKYCYDKKENTTMIELVIYLTEEAKNLVK